LAELDTVFEDGLLVVVRDVNKRDHIIGTQLSIYGHVRLRDDLPDLNHNSVRRGHTVTFGHQNRLGELIAVSRR